MSENHFYQDHMGEGTIRFPLFEVEDDRKPASLFYPNSNNSFFVHQEFDDPSTYMDYNYNNTFSSDFQLFCPPPLSEAAVNCPPPSSDRHQPPAAADGCSPSSELGGGRDGEEDSSKTTQTKSPEITKDGEAGDQQEKSKKRMTKGKKKEAKKLREPRYAFLTKSEIDNLEDGFRWRKYGQKAVKNSPYPRSYYKCTSQKCTVKKRVERSYQDPTTVITTYEGQHNHHYPSSLRGSAAASMLSPPASFLSSTNSGAAAAPGENSFEYSLFQPTTAPNFSPYNQQEDGINGMNQLHQPPFEYSLFQDMPSMTASLVHKQQN
ncbi:unnamed protein product [Cuscuta epithymum]|uniref:WRKY domain-containing protein n=1 Tax=Cuscuta epithymum TaxID=186058 RepID=A0AAV0DE29_9ASTE|nr:unnamed protein product [Cuscuta epithymum]